jgi:nucleoside-diphosphate-sugar epimerase
VTGGSGYIGRSLIQQLIANDFETINIDIRCINAPTNIFDLNSFSDVSCVVHLAGISFSPDHSDLDNQIWKNNVDGTRHVVNFCEKNDIPRLIFASSASVFEKNEYSAFPDTFPKAKSAYGRSKACAERIVQSANIENKVIVRKGTLFGVSDNTRWDLVPNAMMADALSVGKIYVNDRGENFRPFVSHERVVNTYLQNAVCAKPRSSIVHLVDFNTTIKGLARTISDVTGAEIVFRPSAAAMRSYQMVDNSDFPGNSPFARMSELAKSVRKYLEMEDLPVYALESRLEDLKSAHS